MQINDATNLVASVSALMERLNGGRSRSRTTCKPAITICSS